MFVGYSLDSTIYGFLLFDTMVSDISNNNIIESRDVVFLKNIFPMINKFSRPICEQSSSNFVFNKEGSINDQACDECRRSKIRRKNKNFGDDFYTFLFEDDPKTYKEAMFY